MFEQVLESFRKATESSVQMQQEMMRKWVGIWPTTSMTPPMFGANFPLQQMQQKWTDAMTDLVKKQRELLENSFKLGQENIEKAFKVSEAKTPEEVRAKTVELWQKCMESLRETSESQMREFQSATQKWLELMSKPAG
jgi:gas vesicle protein